MTFSSGNTNLDGLVCWTQHTPTTTDFTINIFGGLEDKNSSSIVYKYEDREQEPGEKSEPKSI